MIKKAIEKLLGDPNLKQIKKLQPLVAQINQIEEQFQQEITTDDAIKAKTEEFKSRIAKGETLDDLLPEAFALVKTACRHLDGRQFKLTKLFEKDTNQSGDSDKPNYTWEMIPFDVQLLGGIILHQGKIAEMKTGEGKTLVCTMPLYLNALTGKGAFLVTVNEYLAQRDAEWMGILFNLLGLTVGVNLSGMSLEQKKEAYTNDIVYGTNGEFGFDYLRDNMATSSENLVQKTQNFAIVDEVDSILIDEARTPLIISAPAEESTEKYQRYNSYINKLVADEDYEIDEKMKTATLTEKGIARMEEILGIDNIYTDAGFEEVHHIEQALKANTIFNLDTEYVVKDGEIIIVDEFTGRLMPGRRFSDGLHQALEAKENVEVKRESKTLATITFQNYFRLFQKLAGMTGTAKTEEEEFEQIYGLSVLIVPTNKPVVRKDQSDVIFKNVRGKFIAIATRVKQAHQIGQPVLIGTVSIEKSEALSKVLADRSIPHSVLNAKFHEQEAEIVAGAGEKGAVTIATNMAGRGTDIKMTEEVKGLGGLLVIGTERHESRRIDNQLRGRSGRQGDPGESQFFISMEDELMRLFGGEKIRSMMERLNLPDETPVQNPLISNSIESAQKKVEGRNFDIRKHVVEYDDVINKHREIVYKIRQKILHNESIKNEILLIIAKQAERIVLSNTLPDKRLYDYDEIVNQLELLDSSVRSKLERKLLEDLVDNEALIDHIKTYLQEVYGNKEDQLTDPEVLRQIETNVYLRTIDRLWMDHIDQMQGLRESVALRGYAQRNPLIEYKEQAFTKFQQLLGNIQFNTLNTLFKLDLNHLPPHLLKRPPSILETLRTNADQIEGGLQSAIKKHTTSSNWNLPQADDKPQPFGTTPNTPTADNGIRVVKADNDQAVDPNSLPCAKLGRNEICPECGVKAKKCPKQK